MVTTFSFLVHTYWKFKMLQGNNIKLSKVKWDQQKIIPFSLIQTFEGFSLKNCLPILWSRKRRKNKERVSKVSRVTDFSSWFQKGNYFIGFCLRTTLVCIIWISWLETWIFPAGPIPRSVISWIFTCLRLIQLLPTGQVYNSIWKIKGAILLPVFQLVIMQPALS